MRPNITLGGRDSSGNIMTKLWAQRPEFDSRQGQEFFSWTQGPDRLCGTPCLLSSACSKIFPENSAARAWGSVHLVPRLRICGATPSLSYTSCEYDFMVQCLIKHNVNVALPYNIIRTATPCVKCAYTECKLKVWHDYKGEFYTRRQRRMLLWTWVRKSLLSQLQSSFLSEISDTASWFGCFCSTLRENIPQQVFSHCLFGRRRRGKVPC